MSQNQCFKIIRGTDYDQAVRKHFNQRPLWKNVISKVSVLLDESSVSEMALSTDDLWINTSQILKEENKKLFTKDGKLKNNTKRAREISTNYKRIISDEGLSDFQELRIINFIYGAMRLQGQNLLHFVTSEKDIYYKADFDLAERTNGLVEPITEIEYEEKYLEELKKR